MEGNEVLIEMLEAAGVEVVFSLMSEDIKVLSSRLHTGDINVIEARHEQDAVSMADGYARASGRLGVCIVGRGPAIAQTGNGLLTAQRRQSNVLVIVPESPLSASYDTKDFQQEQFLDTTAGEVVTVRDEARLVPGFDESLRAIASGDGPAVLQIAWDVLDTATSLHADDIRVDRSYTDDRGERPHVEPADAQIEAVVDLFTDINHGTPPVVLAGKGTLDADAKSELEGLAKRMGAVLATTLPMQSYFEDHPYSVGFVGGFGSDTANEFLNQTEFLIAFGCSLNPHTTHNGELIDNETAIVQVDTDPTVVGKHTPVDMGVRGDVAATAELLSATLRKQDVTGSVTRWTDTLKQRLATASPEIPTESGGSDDRADPRRLLSRLDDALPEERLVVTDGGHFTNWIMDYVDVPGPESFIWTLDFSSIGRGLPISIGAGTAIGDRACLAFCGDAGLMMSLSELDTAVRQSIPLYVVVLNDGGYGAEYHQLDLVDKHPESALVETPDVTALAEGFGGVGYELQSTEDVASLDLPARPDGPVVLDCHVTRSVRHRFYEEYHGI